MNIPFTDREKRDFLYARDYEVQDSSEWVERPIHGSRTYMVKEHSTWAVKDGKKTPLEEAFLTELKNKLLKP